MWSGKPWRAGEPVEAVGVLGDGVALRRPAQADRDRLIFVGGCDDRQQPLHPVADLDVAAQDDLPDDQAEQSIGQLAVSGRARVVDGRAQVRPERGQLLGGEASDGLEQSEAPPVGAGLDEHHRLVGQAAHVHGGAHVPREPPATRRRRDTHGWP